MRPAPGTYVLALRAERPARIVAGALGALDVSPGTYLYVGSALGPGGVRGRVARHARPDKRVRWHVDYLAAVASPTEAWVTYDPRRLECDWSAALRTIRGAREPFPGFGASDCGCSTHLLWFARGPTLDTFRRHVRRSGTGGVRIRRVKWSVRATKDPETVTERGVDFHDDTHLRRPL